MISMLLYGRNDAHGYNMHRRVALSLNCLAEALTDSDDEIIFVDYNTPDELPTIIEALADTLTDRCLSRIRVLRVPASLHAARYSDRTHLATVEPVARNAAARRANPSNRWLLSTNTDMILVSLSGRSLSDTCRDLADGYYSLPRFEVPEWVWERFPRSDPQRVLADLEHLGPALHLNEPTLGHEWMRFDAPGDFQLLLREDFVAIDGFDEEMLLGWSVDSNLSRRMLLRRGSIESLEDSVAGYHCNHNRSPTAFHRAQKIENDIDRFYFSVESSSIAAQHETWGLADIALEDVPLQRQIGRAGIDAVLATLPAGSSLRQSSDVTKAPFSSLYDSGHILPFIVDSLVVSPLRTIGYLGINPILRGLLASLVDELGLGSALRIAELADSKDVDEVARSSDLFVVDFGTDRSLLPASNDGPLGGRSDDIPAGLDLVFAGLERLVDVERDRLSLGLHPRRFVLVNSETVYLDPYVRGQFECTSTSFHCRVRRATVRVHLDDRTAESGRLRARALARWALTPSDTSSALRLVPGKPARFADLDDYSGLTAGWAFPDDVGIWTLGSRSELSIAFQPIEATGGCLSFAIEGVCTTPDEPLMVELCIDGVGVAARACGHAGIWRVELPAHVLSAGKADLTISVATPRSPLQLGWRTNDRRPLGLHLRSLSLDSLGSDRSVPPRERVAFAAGMSGERLLIDGWSVPEASGVWTDGDCARLALELGPGTPTSPVLVFEMTPFVSAEHPRLAVEVWIAGSQIERRVFREGDLDHRLVVGLPELARNTSPIDIEFRVDAPARPIDLGMSSDTRWLGLFLRSLTIESSVRSQPRFRATPRSHLMFRARAHLARLVRKSAARRTSVKRQT